MCNFSHTWWFWLFLLASGEHFLASLDHEAAAARADAYAPGTVKNLLTQIWTNLLFCSYADIAFLPISFANLIRYIMFLSRSFTSYTSVLNYINRVRYYHAIHSVPFYHMTDFHVSLTLRGVRKKLIHTPSQKLPITITVLEDIYRLLDLTCDKHVVLWTAFLVAFFGFLRKSNLVPPSAHKFDQTKHLSRNSFTIMEDGSILLELTWSKTNQFSDRKVIIPFSQIPNSPLCPVAAFKRMISQVPAPPTAPAFSLPVPGRLIPLTHQSFVADLKVLLTRASYDPTRYSGHSFRRGGCTFASTCNVPAELLKIHGDWRSSAYERYLHIPIIKRRQVADQMAAGLTKSKHPC